MAEPRIRAEQAGHSYDGRRWQFRALDLMVSAGEIVAVLGPNGRGKSTLLRAIAGLIAPNAGRIAVADAVGFVPQAFMPAFSYSAIEIVLMGRTRHIPLLRAPGRRDREIAAACLAELGIAALAQRAFASLSGGERQLVLIAHPLAGETPILLLDEPAAALDLHHQDEVMALIRTICDDRQLAVLFTTHHPDHALAIADRVLLMGDDERHLIGPTAETMTEAHLAELYKVPVRLLRFAAEGRELTAFAPVFRSQVLRSPDLRSPVLHDEASCGQILGGGKPGSGGSHAK
ncbi:ABC transporter ATP-binding protein [Bosea sp. 2RAB26]|uniref:ABC transporter ATP-binding protein n=1 Tax=Bosea sp. 2RAB26 TaxID=3237476 RepID=UPI003F939A8E